jgi:hypothetical protein
VQGRVEIGQIAFDISVAEEVIFDGLFKALFRVIEWHKLTSGSVFAFSLPRSSFPATAFKVGDLLTSRAKQLDVAHLPATRLLLPILRVDLARCRSLDGCLSNHITTADTRFA